MGSNLNKHSNKRKGYENGEYSYKQVFTIKEVQIKTTRYFQSIKIVKIKNTDTSNSTEQLKLPYLAGWEYKMVQPVGEIDWQFLVKLNMHLNYNLAIPLIV